jgi:hypothetical protein
MRTLAAGKSAQGTAGAGVRYHTSHIKVLRGLSWIPI